MCCTHSGRILLVRRHARPTSPFGRRFSVVWVPFLQCYIGLGVEVGLFGLRRTLRVDGLRVDNSKKLKMDCDED